MWYVVTWKAGRRHYVRQCRTRPRNIPLAMTIKNDGHGSMSMELRYEKLNKIKATSETKIF